MDSGVEIAPKTFYGKKRSTRKLSFLFPQRRSIPSVQPNDLKIKNSSIKRHALCELNNEEAAENVRPQKIAKLSNESPVKTVTSTEESDKHLEENSLKVITEKVDFNINKLVEDEEKVKDSGFKSCLVRTRNVARESSGLCQMMLDFGQQRVGSVECGDCGMLYLPHSEEDSALHHNFHRQHVTFVHFPGWKRERVIKKYIDGRVIHIRPDDPKFALRKVEQMKQVMNLNETSVSTTSHTFLFVREKLIIGCAIAEPISEAYPIVVAEPLCRSTKSVTAVCGIDSVWTAVAHRRRRIASRLLDCVRANFYYGCIIPQNQLAFSDPSRSGMLLAQHYTNSSTFLLY